MQKTALEFLRKSESDSGLHRALRDDLLRDERAIRKLSSTVCSQVSGATPSEYRRHIL